MEAVAQAEFRQVQTLIHSLVCVGGSDGCNLFLSKG